MGFVQAVLGGLFTILGAASLFFIAYKALTIGSDVVEIKELLRQMKASGPGTGETSAPRPLPDLPLPSSEEAYLAALNAYQPLEPVPEPAPKPKSDFVLPPPISRRLDAERGLRRPSTDESHSRS